MKRTQPMRHCTASKIADCRARQRDCRHCPPMPPEGLQQWLWDTGYRSTDYRPQRRRIYSEHELEIVFRKKVLECENGCWKWTGSFTDGYPILKNGQRHVIAYRWAYAHFHNVPLSRRQVALQTCGNRKCVNPDHVEIVSNRDRRFLRMKRRRTSRRTYAQV